MSIIKRVILQTEFDNTSFKQQTAEADNALKGVSETAKEIEGNLKQAFTKDGVEAYRKAVVKSFDSIGVASASVSKNLENANAKLKQISATILEQEKITNEFRREYEALNAELKKSDADFNPGALKIKQRLGELKEAITDNVISIKQLKIEEKEAKSTVKSLSNIEKEVNRNIKASGNLRKQLIQLKKELDTIDDEGSPRFIELSVQAGQLEDKIGDVNNRVRVLASDSAKLDAFIGGMQGLVGVFSVAQGAAALLGKENEDLQKGLLKVQAAMAVLNGLQAVQNTLNKDSAFSIILLSKAKQLYTFVTGAATAATMAFRAALIATGAGAIIVALGLIVAYWKDIAEFIGLSNEGLEKQKQLEEQLLELIKERRKVIEDFKNTYTGTIGLARLELKLAELRGASEDEILEKKRYLLVAEADLIKNRINYNGLMGDSLKLEQVNLQIIQAQIQAIDNKVKARKRDNEELIKNLQILTGNESEQAVEKLANAIKDAYLKSLQKAKPDFARQLGDMIGKMEVPPMKITAELEQSVAMRKYLQEQLPADIAQGIQIATDAIFQIQEQNRQRTLNADIENLRKRREAELNNAELTEAQKLYIQAKFQQQEAALRKRAFEQQKQSQLAQASINGALAITNILATMPGGPINPATVASIALAAATTAAQVAVISSQKFPGYKDGVLDFKGKGTSRSDSNLVRISAGETITDAEKTQKYYPVLKAIHEDRFEQFLAQRGFEGSRMDKVKSIKRERYTPKKRGKDSIIIHNFEQVGKSVARNLGQSGYTKRN